MTNTKYKIDYLQFIIDYDLHQNDKSVGVVWDWSDHSYDTLSSQILRVHLVIRFV